MQNFKSLFRLDGKVALIAGAASGIGRAAAHGLAQAGAIALCADLNQQGAEDAASEIRAEGGQAEATVLDITNAASVTKVVRQVEEKYHRLDILLSTPAVNVRKPLLNYSTEEFEKVISVNLRGNFLIAQAAARIMAENKSGSIILLSSIRSLVVEPGQGVYAATKAGLVQLARTFAAELGGAGVRVNCIAPGVVDTPLTQPIKSKPDWYAAYANKNALGRWASADEMVGPVIFLASDAASYVTGTVLFVDGGWTAIDGRFQPPL